ncbi:MAG: hypothetical protein EA362_03695 [Saprospirales bacterium]|nr:MAG: hypothetical protein EA362_03695 [Saprospirales bacterium]
MDITNDKKIADIQREFSEKFPKLKIEFYKKPHETGEGSKDELKHDPNSTIGEIRKKGSEGDLSIHGNLKVETLEANFQEQFGLNAQVFRKSGNIWLQTTKTDDWTLSEQNDRGAS